MDVERKARIIAMGSQKGGVGKTTHAVHIARALAERGRKVLIVDLDMNHGATRHFGIAPEAYPGSYEMLAEGKEASNLVLTSEDEEVWLPENLHLVPGARKLEGIDQALGQKSFTTPREVLRRPLESLRGQYDYIFLDTAPFAATLTISSYLAADYFILSAMPDPFAVACLDDALALISSVQQSGHPNLTLLGVILSRVDKRTTLANSLSKFVEKSFKVRSNPESMRFKTSIGRSTVIPQTQNMGKTLFETHSTHSVTVAYRALTGEIEERLAKLESGGVIRTWPMASDIGAALSMKDHRKSSTETHEA